MTFSLKKENRKFVSGNILPRCSKISNGVGRNLESGTFIEGQMEALRCIQRGLQPLYAKIYAIDDVVIDKFDSDSDSYYETFIEDVTQRDLLNSLIHELYVLHYSITATWLIRECVFR